MMKSFAALILLVASVSFADPKVGDQTVMDFTISSSGQNFAGTMSNELTAFDASKDEFTMRTVIEANGSVVQDKTMQKKSSDFLTDAQMNQVMTSCASFGGRAETTTVPAGTFQTCAVTQNSNGQPMTAWYAVVPFSLVKIEMTSATGSSSFQLKSYQLGQ